MAEHKPQFNLYTTNLTTGTSRKFTEKYPKLDATTQDFQKAGTALQAGYGQPLLEATLQSETTVYTYGG